MFVVIESQLRYHAQCICDVIDGTVESMWIVSACNECKKKLRTTQGDKQMRAGAQNAQQLRRDCALTSSSTHSINRPDSHKLKPETRPLHTMKLADRGLVDILQERCPGPFRCSLAVNCVSIAMLHTTVGFFRLAPDVIEQLGSSCPLDV